VAESIRQTLEEQLPGTWSHGSYVLQLPSEQLLATVHKLRDALAFDVFLDVTAVDWPNRTPRFEVVYHFYSSRHHLRVRVKCGVGIEDPELPSLTELYGSAALMERECHDMYGIRFTGHGDLRPILLYEGFVGHPLRKDYPKRQEQPLVPYRKSEAGAP